MLYPGGPSIVQPRRDCLRFTRNADDGTSPLITAAAAADADFVWRGPGGPFTGKQPNISNFPVGDFSLDSRVWALITQLNFSDRKLTGFDVGRLLFRLTALQRLLLGSNATWTDDTGGWVLPAALLELDFSGSGVTGDINGWVLPSTMTTLKLHYSNVTGDISGWVLPAALTILQFYQTALSGDISGWVLPAATALLYLYNSNVTGDISGWVLPVAAANYRLHTTALSGDISGWVLPATMSVLYLYNTAIAYGVGGMFATATRDASTYRLDDCALTTAEVDRVLADCVASTTTGSTLNVAGSNQAPTDGINNAYRLELVNNRGWTVTVTP